MGIHHKGGYPVNTFHLFPWIGAIQQSRQEWKGFLSCELQQAQ